MKLKYKFLLIGVVFYSLGIIFIPDTTIPIETIGNLFLIAGAFLLGCSTLLLAQESEKRIITAKRG